MKTIFLCLLSLVSAAVGAEDLKSVDCGRFGLHDTQICVGQRFVAISERQNNNLFSSKKVQGMKGIFVNATGEVIKYRWGHQNTEMPWTETSSMRDRERMIFKVETSSSCLNGICVGDKVLGTPNYYLYSYKSTLVVTGILSQGYIVNLDHSAPGYFETNRILFDQSFGSEWNELSYNLSSRQDPLREELALRFVAPLNEKHMALGSYTVPVNCNNLSPNQDKENFKKAELALKENCNSESELYQCFVYHFPKLSRARLEGQRFSAINLTPEIKNGCTYEVTALRYFGK